MILIELELTSYSSLLKTEQFIFNIDINSRAPL